MASSSSSSSFPNIYSWIQNLPPINQWETTCKSINLCPSSSIHPSLNLSLSTLKNSKISLSITANYNIPIPLWTSKKITPNPTSKTLIDRDGGSTTSTSTAPVAAMLCNFIEDVLRYCSTRSGASSSVRLPRGYPLQDRVAETFNAAFVGLSFVVCIYEAPADLRGACLHSLREQLARPETREASKMLMRQMGSGVEERWMRSMNLAITNWTAEMQAARASPPETPLQLFSYSFSMVGLWKVQLYCPIIAMTIVKASGPSPDDRLAFSLNYHQLEGVIQLNHRVAVREKWIEIKVNTDNIRCDVVKLLTDTLMSERGAGPGEKHFPSRVALQMTPMQQASVISVSVGKSSENAAREIGVEKGIEASFEPPAGIGLHFSAGESHTTSLRPWKFEPSVYGNAANLNWFLHDSEDGREVFSSRPSKLALLHPRAWFKNRYSNVNRPFTRQGGVIFAGDEYGESVSWKVEKGCLGGVMEWEIKGWIWLTYWPNKHRTFYTETKRLEFREVLQITLI
ncbi:uncharacterized protein LOC125219721 [Salvia hispanica]|uniref:uncharacterized protein LOC125219721 n=1 Tax=Salvia hispanica TaxID=49212 RepID=UPI0020091BF9|nr:uncharacterized protein LOC125219721 [Salvia hispanica]